MRTGERGGRARSGWARLALLGAGLLALPGGAGPGESLVRLGAVSGTLDPSGAGTSLLAEGHGGGFSLVHVGKAACGGFEVRLEATADPSRFPYYVRLREIDRPLASSDPLPPGLEGGAGGFVYPGGGASRAWCLGDDRPVRFRAEVFAARRPEGERWLKAALHVHTMRSLDGWDFPEVVAGEYKDAGYHFVAFTEHYEVPTKTKWIIEKQIIRRAGDLSAVDLCVKRFGSFCQSKVGRGNIRAWRLRTVDELNAHPAIGEKDHFLLATYAEEITVNLSESVRVHQNVFNVKAETKVPKSTRALELIDGSCADAETKRNSPKAPVLCMVAHPNYPEYRSVSEDDLAMATKPTIVEVYNGAHKVTYGDATHPSDERLWDLANAQRLALFGRRPLWGSATDDAHIYGGRKPARGPDHGWVWVRSGASFDTASVVNALNAGDFVGSTGVRLKNLRYDPGCVLAIELDEGPDAEIQFLGVDRRAPIGAPGWKTHPGVGKVYQTTRGPRAVYVPTGDELFVRAKVTVPRPPRWRHFEAERQTLWTQPCVLPRG